MDRNRDVLRMPRITKPPLIRKNEIINTAELLFLKKGYDRTTVNDIVSAIDVAKGTFYHYFKSKTDVLGAIVEKNISFLEEEFRGIISRDDLNSPQKLNEMLNASFRWFRGKEELMVFIHQESNAVPHYNFEEMAYERLVPPIVEVIAKGTGEGRFNVLYPTQMAEVILAAITHQLHRPEFASSKTLRERMRITMEQFLSRVLKEDEFSFKLESWH